MSESSSPDSRPDSKSEETLDPMRTSELGGTLGGYGYAGIREGVGSEIGVYRLVALIGEGGFGSVFRAWQERPVRREVALKIIKLGMDTRQVVARFDQERQALAVMDHPHIAKVFDAGVTETGRPYFVMEYCKGEAITAYCDRRNLSIPERFALFVQVCEAVQHAHQKGIIHRDIKPSNVLVSEESGKPGAKVIDFGIAKATDTKLIEEQVFTEQAQMIGTPQYMSPEQATGSADIDTRTDVYALGVLLYELLTGTTPFDSRSLRSAAYAEMQRIIREVDPPRPSTRLSELTENVASVAAQRRLEPRRLGMLVRGELDWIVMKAIEKDRDRRYESANGLAMDIQRYLSGEAVVAAPPSRRYRVGKFVRRNRGLVTGASAVAGTLVVGVAAFAWQAKIAGEQRDLAVQSQVAEAAQRKEAGEQRDLAVKSQLAEAAQRKQADAQRDLAIQSQLAEAAQRKLAEEQRVAATEQRDRAVKAEQVAKTRADDLKLVSDFQARMLEQIDSARAGQGLSEDVIAKLTAALAKADPPVPEGDRAGIVEAFKAQWGRVNMTDTARDFIDRTLLRPAVNTIDVQFKGQPVIDAQLRGVLARRYADLGLYGAALPLQTSALATRRKVLGDDSLETIESMEAMGELLGNLGKPAEAVALFREAYDRRQRVQGEDHPLTITSMSALGNAVRIVGKFDEAEPLLRSALEHFRRVIGNEDFRTMTAMNTLGQLYVQQRKYAEAEVLWREAYETAERVLPGDSKDVLIFENNLSMVLQDQNKNSEAEPLTRECVARAKKVWGEEHPSTLTLTVNLANLLIGQDKLSEGEALHREVYEKRRRLLGPTHPQTMRSLERVGNALRLQKKYAESEPLLEDVLAFRRRTLTPAHIDIQNILPPLAQVKEELGKFGEAEALWRELLADRVASLPKGDARIGMARSVLGGALLAQKRFAEAEPVLIEGFEEMAASRSTPRTPKDYLGDGAERLVNLYTAWDQSDPGKGYDVKAAEWQRKLKDAKASSRPSSSRPSATQPAGAPVPR